MTSRLVMMTLRMKMTAANSPLRLRIRNGTMHAMVPTVPSITLRTMLACWSVDVNGASLGIAMKTGAWKPPIVQDRKGGIWSVYGKRKEKKRVSVL